MTPIAGGAFAIATALKVVIGFTILLVVVAVSTVVERKVAAFIQDRSGPNRVGPWGLLQFAADGLKNIIKEETMPAGAIKPFFLLAPALAIFPGTVLFAVIPVASPLPTQWGLVEMIVADVSIGFLYLLAIGSLGQERDAKPAEIRVPGRKRIGASQLVQLGGTPNHHRHPVPELGFDPLRDLERQRLRHGCTSLEQDVATLDICANVRAACSLEHLHQLHHRQLVLTG